MYPRRLECGAYGDFAKNDQTQTELSEKGKKIVEQLRSSSKTTGELRDALGIGYQELDAELVKLRVQNIVSYQFAPYMIYQLVGR